MELNEIKKELYKKKPDANFVSIKNGIAHYKVILQREKDDTEGSLHYYTEKVLFDIPITDMGTSEFGPNMPARLLIRWINKH